jgi:hypothetical protein
MSAQEYSSQHSDMSTPYTGGFHPDSDIGIPADQDISASSHAMPGLSAVQPSSSVGSPDGSQADTPGSFITPKIEHNEDEDAECLGSILVAPSAAPSATEPTPVSNVRNDDKIDEPYAKLIYKALMSQMDYTMTLQELYQWFRDNTGKAKNERGGWQNSIRHNLSMNAVSESQFPKLALCFLFLSALPNLFLPFSFPPALRFKGPSKWGQHLYNYLPGFNHCYKLGAGITDILTFFYLRHSKDATASALRKMPLQRAQGASLHWQVR